MLTQVLPKSEISARENLNWLFILRNLMLAGESLLIIILVYVLNINLPQEQLWPAILSIGAVNLYTWMRLRTDAPITEGEIFSQLCIDVFAIASLLYMTGGASNPITWVFLLPLIVTAIILPQTYAWYMVILTTSMYTLLISYNVPLPSIEPHEIVHEETLTPLMVQKMQHMHKVTDKNYFNLHIFGMWFGFVFSAGLVAYFVVELAKTVRERERRLAEARENALRNERLVALGALAASAAHDMGTPLGTMAIVTHDLLQDYPEHRYPELHDRLNILQQQIARCKTALSVMSASGGEMRAESGKAIAVIDYLDGILNQWRAQNPSTKLNLAINPNVLINSKIIAEQTLTHAIINILNNAAEVSPTDKGIDFEASWDEHTLTLKIRDYGPGMPPELIKAIGIQPVNSKKQQGMGVGLFLTCTTIRRLKGEIAFLDASPNGTCVHIELRLLQHAKSLIHDNMALSN
jgi:two-component system, sensor histidine kinase RegB